MLLRSFFAALGCLIAWLVVLPALAVVGGTALFLYATLAEIISMITGEARRSSDPSAIQVAARRICSGYAFSLR